MLDKEDIVFTDEPLKNPEQDKLRFAPFAEKVANSIKSMQVKKSVVFAINGKWGAGKTTFLNFITYYLQNEGSIVIVKFNPWWFSGKENLLQQFFNCLMVTLNESKKFKLKELLQKFYIYSAILQEIPINKVKKLAKISRKVIEEIYMKKSVFDIKEEIIEMLMKINGKVVVMIDDIDRLTANEIRELFTIIRAIADFPNIVYILAFDKDIVIKALEKVQEGNGKEYLEKFIQVSIDLPRIDEYTVRKFFLDELKKIIADSPNDLFNPDYFYEVFSEGIAPFINTFRNAIRLLNSLSITYASVKGEVNVVDFIAIETLRIFCPEVYTLISNNLDMFCETQDFSSRVLLKLNLNYLKQFHNDWITNLNYPENHKEAIKKLLIKLFPKVRSAFENYTYSWDAKWEREYRICIKDFSYRYFIYSVPSDDLSKAQIEGILSSLSNKENFINFLKSLAKQKRFDRSTKLSVFLERMNSYISEIQINDIPIIVETFLKIGDELIIPEDNSLYGNDKRMRDIINQLLFKIESKEKRFKILEDAFKNGAAIYMMVMELVSLWKQHGEYGGVPENFEERLLAKEHLEILKNITLSKIREAAKSNRLLDVPFFTSVLYYWGVWGNKDEPKNWINNNILPSDELFLKFLLYLLIYLKPITKAEFRKDLENFADLDILKNKCEQYLSKNISLDDKSKLIISQILDLIN